MKPKDPSPQASAEEEIAELISNLHDTEERLEQLTLGEVDAVVDSSGRTRLLRRAQDRLRLSEAAKQASILNALSAHIALLDVHGVVISVNEAWRQFADANALRGPAHAIGANYLEICDVAQGMDCKEAKEVAHGIRSVLEGRKKSFSIKYPCHSPQEQRWFLLTVTPLGDGILSGAVAMHVDITREIQADESLKASESRFRQMAENISDVFFLLDVASGLTLYVSPAYETLCGRSCESLYASPTAWAEAIHPADRASTEEKYTAGLATGKFDLQYRIVRPDGSLRWVESRGFPVADDAGRIVRIAGVAKDFTERREAENRIKGLLRVRAMLSGINTLIVHAQHRDELFTQACRIAVEQGGFRMAWVGIVDRDLMQVVPVASAGLEEGILNAARGHYSLKQDESPDSLVIRAVSGKWPVVSNEAQTDPRVMTSQAFRDSGIRSIVVFPLIVSDEAVGVLVLYASETDFFHDEEMELLTELAGDIAFAIDHIDKRDRLDYLRYYDALTGLANRGLFLERMAQHLRAAAKGGHQFAVFLVDLERFKSINDSLGRPAGDSLLKQVADWIGKKVGDTSLAARLGADHFAIILPKVNPGGDVRRLIERAMNLFLEHRFRLGEAEFRIATRVGIAIYPEDGSDAEALFRNAEAALKMAKTTGDRYMLYTPAMTASVSSKLAMENQLRQALDNREFVLHYQPKIDLASGKLTGAEALIRWNDPRTGLVPPGRFIPILEETGLIHGVGRWAMRTAIEDYLRWRAAGLPAVRIAVNVSPLQLRSLGFVKEIREVIAIGAHAEEGLELEVTESLVMADVALSVATLEAIRALGVCIAIDDFGTGFSSLSYLSRLPVDTLKIDRSFVTDMTSGPDGFALVSTIIGLAHALKLKVVAEGVETAEQSLLLRGLRCDEMQGFLFSRPVPADVFEATFLRPAPAG